MVTLYHRPDNLFVAGFIGSPAMNLLRGRIDAAGPQAEFVADDGGKIALPGLAVPAALPGRPLVLGVRPEDVRLVEPGTEDAVTGRVVIVEPMGPETHVTMQVGGAEFLGAFRNRIMPAPGQALHFAIDPQSVHLFEAASGQRLA